MMVTMRGAQLSNSDQIEAAVLFDQLERLCWAYYF